jgi:hypothetical protein
VRLLSPLLSSMNHSVDRRPEMRKDRSWSSTVMAGASFVAVTQFATRGDFNSSHKIAIVCFALALPVFVICAIEPGLPKDTSAARFTRRLNCYMALATSLFCIGVVALFFSFGIWTGVALVSGCAIAFSSFFPTGSRN